MSSTWFFWALLSAAFAAATAILAKFGLKDVDPDAAQLVRTAVVLAAVAALVFGAGKGEEIASFSGKTWSFLVLSGLATAASWICYFRALAVGDVARVGSIDKLSVPMVAVAAALLFGEKLGMQGWLGVAMSVAGAWLLTGNK